MKTSLRESLLVLLFCAANAHAAVSVTIGSTSLAAGSSTLLPVYISASTASVNLASANYQFLLTTTAGGSFLQFGSTDTSGATDGATSPSYVFSGNSIDQNIEIPVLGPPLTINTPNDSITGGDSTNDGSNVVLPVSGNFLLVYLPITAALGASSGDSYVVSLVPTNGLNSSTSNFQDNLSNYLPFSSISGEVTVSNVPEPSTYAAIAGTVMLGFAFWHRRRQIV
jgi:hypothetical protein